MPDKAFQNKTTLLFVPNEVQTDEKARFIARMNGQHFYLMADGIAAVFYSGTQGNSLSTRRASMHMHIPAADTTLHGTAIFLTFEGAAQVEPQGQQQAQGRSHYFTGNDPANWRTMLPSFAQLQYANLWEGVDLTLVGGEGGLKFLWSLKAARNVSSIRIRYEGAEEIRLSEDGSLVIRHALGELIDPAPIAWQEIGEKNVPVVCAYDVDGDVVSFVLYGAYDADAPLLIDPILSYSTYLGGSSTDWGYAVAADAQGCAYVAGATLSFNFPTTPGAFKRSFSGSEMAYLTKFAPDGKTLVYSTFLGGSGSTACFGIALDAQRCAYLTGFTSSGSFPVTAGAFQTAYGGGSFDAFVTKLSADGARLVYSTFLGGGDLDRGYDVAVDALGCAYAAGATSSNNFPVSPGTIQPTLRGSQDSFIVKLSPDGTSLIYSTFFGGTATSYAHAVAVDDTSCAYITGGTTCADLTVTPGAFQTTYGGNGDAFVAKLTADGASLVYSTYLGGSNNDTGYGIAVDVQYRAVVAGYTESKNLPTTPGAFQPISPGGIQDAFVTKLAPDGGSLIASTYLGGNRIDGGYNVALDQHGNVYVTGYTDSNNFPVTPQVVPSSPHGRDDAFVSILSPELNRLLVSYYLGGSNSDYGTSITAGPDGAVYAAGYTRSTDFPVTPGTFQTANGGDFDAFATRAGFALLKKASIVLQELQ